MDTAQPRRSRSAWPPGNAVAALVVGALTGSALLPVAVIVAALVTTPLRDGASGALSAGAGIVIVFFLLSLPVWGLGLIMVGIPGWMVLHALGWRSRAAGTLFGGVATFVVSGALGLSLNLRPAEAPWAFPLAIAVLGLIGAVVGRVVVVTSHGDRENAR